MRNTMDEDIQEDRTRWAKDKRIQLHHSKTVNSLVWHTDQTFRVDGRQQEEIKKSGLSESIKKLGAMLSFSALYLGCPWILDW